MARYGYWYKKSCLKNLLLRQPFLKFMTAAANITLISFPFNAFMGQSVRPVVGRYPYTPLLSSLAMYKIARK